jgi:hypothetical protein
MSMRVVGLIPVDGRWRAMKAVWDSCLQLKIEPPVEVVNFFEGEYPEEEESTVTSLDYVRKYNSEMREGLEVDLKHVPKDVQTIRFYCSW